MVFGLEVPWEYFFEGDDFSYERLHRKLIECPALLTSTVQCYNQGTMTKEKKHCGTVVLLQLQ